MNELPKETLEAFGGDNLRARTFREKYALRDLENNIVELVPEEMWNRVATAIASVEDGYDKQESYRDKFYEILRDFKFIPGGRIMFGAGQDRKATLLNCFSGTTPVLYMENGEVKKSKIIDLVGRTVDVLTEDYGWTPARFDSFGIQKLYKVTLLDGQEFHVTREHDWVIYSNGKHVKKKTCELRPQCLFDKHYDILPLITVERPEKNEEWCAGVRHGIVFGDGSQYKTSAQVSLFGDKRCLKRFFTDCSIIEHENYTYIGAIKDGNMKTIPSSEKSANYWYGFFCGLLSTDGFVSGGNVGIDQENLDVLKEIEHNAYRIGVYTQPIKEYYRTNSYNDEKPFYRLLIRSFSQRIEDLLRPEHIDRFDSKGVNKYIGVFSVEETNLEQEVYCCVEPKSHTFTIGKGVLTGQCYVIPIESDTIEGIFKWCSNAARTYSYGGGVGVDISILRPRGAPVSNCAITSTGAVSFMDLLSKVTGTIGQSGRRGAQMTTIDVSHPDIEEFIDIKNDPQHLNVRFSNISVKVTDEFMKAVEDNADFPLEYGGKVYKYVKAQEIWNKIIKSAHQSAEPGVLFWDTTRKGSPTEYNGMEVLTTNPCGEQPLQPFSNCCLGSINLSKYVINPFSIKARFDFVKFGQDARTAVRFLDNVITYNEDKHPLPEQKKAGSESRRIGLGVTGLGDTLAMLSFVYGDESSIAFMEILFNELRYVSYSESINLAKEKGTFPLYDANEHKNGEYIKNLPDSLQNLLEKYGIRNSCILTIPPVGSGSVLAGCSSGIEPVFQLKYTRRSESLSEEYYEVKHPAYELHSRLKESGNPDIIKHDDAWITAHDIRPMDRVKVQSIIQKYIDSSISSTVNLPEDISVSDVSDIYRKAWQMGCKGITVYREGSREGILISDKTTEKVTEPLAEIDDSIFNDRPLELTGTTFKVPTGHGNMYLTVNLFNKRPVEVFINIGKSGLSTTADAEALGRLISLALRRGTPITDICAQLEHIGGNKQVFANGSLIKSVPDAVAKVLRDNYTGQNKVSRTVVGGDVVKSIDNEIKMLSMVPDFCLQPMACEAQHSGGCVTCFLCEDSKCG